MNAAWEPGRFFVGSSGGVPSLRHGYLHRGLGLHHHGWARPRSKTRWVLTHIGSGSVIATFVGSVSAVFPVAKAIAECSDWELFDMPLGWRQTDPDLPSKVMAILAECPFGDRPEGTPMTAEEARAVIAAREAADG